MQLMKLVAAMVLGLSSVSAFAALDSGDVLKAIAGNYRLEINNAGDDVVAFTVKKNGDVVVDEKNDMEAAVVLNVAGSEAEDKLNGLPVVHLVVSYGSDEDVVDYHVLMTALQGGHGEIEPVMVAKFSTWNDGPNGNSNVNDYPFRVFRNNTELRTAR